MLTMKDTSRDWLTLNFNTNPLDESYDQFVGFRTTSILFKYYALMVNEFLEAFKPPSSVRLNQLSTAAVAKFEEVRERSLTGLQYVVDKKNKLVLDISLEPATIVLTKGGVFDEKKSTVLMDLGMFTIKTVDEIEEFAAIQVNNFLKFIFLILGW